MTSPDSTRVHRVTRGPVDSSDGLSAVTLVSPRGVVASFVPEAGMVGCSLTVDGREVLGLRGGVPAYLAQGKTFGIPLLAPWANRLSGDIYRAAGEECTVSGVRGVRRDANGLPIHGLLAGARGWQVAATEGGPDQAHVRALLPFTADRDEFDGFPFPHDIVLDLLLEPHGPDGVRLGITTTIVPLTEQPVPVAFGWHPYFCPPDAPRAEWEVHLPFTERLLLDERNLPTGAVEQVPPVSGALGERTLDDLYQGVAAGTEAWVAAGGLRITVRYDDAYPYAIVYAPAAEDLIAIEPMTARTNPFARGGGLVLAEQGVGHSATYSILIERV